jgi:hypothetical protein
MCDEYTKPKLIREDKLTNMNAAIKKIDKTNITGLNSHKKQLLKKHMGSVSFKIDMNKVREWWKSLFS